MIRGCRWLLSISILLVAVPAAIGSEAFVGPGQGVPEYRPVWGHRNGLQVGVAPAPGPHGLIRLYAPYLGMPYPRVVNFLSIEPTRRGDSRRGQSELEMSRERPGERGLTFQVTDFEVAEDDSSARLWVHTEPFENGTRPIVEIIFHRDQPHEIEIVLHAHEESAPMSECVVSATMGNFGLLRELPMRGGRVASALELWKGAELDRLDFFPWRTWPGDQFETDDRNRVVVEARTDVRDLESVSYAAGTAPHWIYRGRLGTHVWKAWREDRPIVAVNGRRTYWMSQSPIPGGPAIENFELRMPFRDGLRLWFAVEPKD